MSDPDKLQALYAEMQSVQESLLHGTFIIDILKRLNAEGIALDVVRKYQAEVNRMSMLKASISTQQELIDHARKNEAIDAFHKSGDKVTVFPDGTRATIRATYDYNTQAVFDYIIGQGLGDHIQTEVKKSVNKTSLKKAATPAEWQEVERLRDLKSVSAVLRRAGDAEDE